MIKKAVKVSISFAVVASSLLGNAFTVSAIENNAYGKVSVEKNDNEVTIGNDAISRTFQIGSNKLVAGKISNKLGNSEFTPTNGSEEFLIRLLGKEANRQEPSSPLTSVKPEVKGGTSVKVGSNEDKEGKAENAIDGDTSTYWASTETGEDFLELDFLEEKNIKTIEYTPRYDQNAKYQCTGRIDKYKLEYWNGNAWQDLASGSFDYASVEGKQTITLDSEITTSKIKLTAPETYHWKPELKGKVMNVAEIDVKDASGNSVIEKAKKGWSITGTSVSTSEGSGYEGLIDGNLNTYYHSNYGKGEGTSKQLPVDLTIDRGETASANPFQTLGYRPRVENENANGNIKGYEIYVSDDQATLYTEGNLKKKGTFQYKDVYTETNNPKYIYTSLDAEQTGRYVGLRVTSSAGENLHAAGSEIDLYKEKFDSVIESADNKASEIKASDLTLKDVKVSDTSATINEVKKNGQMLTFVFEPVQAGAGEMTIKQKVVMYDGDFFMRKFLEIENTDKELRIDYIDGEHLKTSTSDKTWTIPTDAEGIVEMDKEIANLGQPIYINGMFIGSEFPATDTQIVDELGRTRYYTGKNFNDFKRDNQLTEDGKYVSWQTVVGASHDSGNNTQIIQSDFFEYIDSIATPSEFRIQYNSWFDNMMRITDENILSSFSAVDKHLSDTGVRPLDSYVVDDGWNIYRQNPGDLQGADDIERNGKDDVNKDGFWTFNSKFPNGLTPSSQLVQNFGSNFGVWIGPRGGYNYHYMLADIITKGTEDGHVYGSKAGDSIDVADDRYVKKFEEMAINWMRDYQVNYWKWDGFADRKQFNAFPKGEGVVGYDEAHCHMYGGVNGFYHVTDLWEKWIDLFVNVRKAEKQFGISKLWISLTCYVNPSPWYLQWANSVWIQCTGDRGEVSNRQLNNKMDNMLTYRDACYYDFVVNHEFQFPLANIYNHDPIYGKEGTDIDANSMNGEEFRNYLFMQGTRGTAFWELYYSDSLFDEEKYLINADFLEWAEANFDELRNAKMIGGTPAQGIGLQSSPTTNGFIKTQDAYGFACFNVDEGIISMRNPDDQPQTITFTLDETIGVEKDGTYYISLDHGYVPTGELTDHANSYQKGDKITITLQPGEVQIWNLTQNKKPAGATVEKIYTKSANTIQVKADGHVNEDSAFTVKVNGKTTTVKNVKEYGDLRSFDLTLDTDLEDGMNVVVEATLDGKKSTISTKYYQNGIVAQKDTVVTKEAKLSDKERSIVGENGFSVSAKVKTNDKNIALVKQGNEYALGIDAAGHPYFTVNGVTATSNVVVSDKYEMIITGVRENNGLIKIYIDGQVNKSAYDATKHTTPVKADDILVSTVNGSLKDIKVYNESLGYDEVPQTTLHDLILKVEAEKDIYTVESWTKANMDALLAEAKQALNVMDNDVRTTAYNNLYNGYKQLIPATVKNLGLGKNASAAWLDGDTTTPVTNTGSPLSNALDGKISSKSYAIFGRDQNKKPSYMTVDLGELSNIQSIKLYRYWENSRTYNSTAIVVSNTEDFKEKKVLYYSGDSDVFNLGVEPKDTLYQENADGKVIYDGEAIEGRYVRIYGLGVKDGGDENHIVELEIFGSEKNADPYNLKELRDLMTQAEKELIKEAIYTEASLNALQKAYDNAKEVVTNVENDTQSDKTIGYVINAKEQLSNALASLVELSKPVNKDTLKALIASVEALDKSLYTDESWANLETELANAKKVLANQKATEDEVKKAVQSLQEAIDQLVKKGTEKPSPNPDPETNPNPIKPEGNNSDNTNAPNTGDTTNAITVFTVLFVSSAVLILLLNKNKFAKNKLDK